MIVYVVVCAAPLAERIRELIEAAQARGHDVCLICTPTAARWLEADIPALAELTGHPVRSAYKMPAEPDVLPPAEAMIVAPLTFNTLNKWAAGISDTLALGLVNEALGNHIPIVAAPYLNDALAAHPAAAGNLETLRAAGVAILYPDRTTDPWDLLLDTLSTRRR
jgi:hypothetical protein